MLKTLSNLLQRKKYILLIHVQGMDEITANTILLRRTVVLTEKGFIAGHQGANGIVSVLQHPGNINH